MNDRSSRSHAILTLWIEITTEGADFIENSFPVLFLDGRTQKSKLNMVDLAGSERTRKTGTQGTIAKEATYINKSLSCLSMVCFTRFAASIWVFRLQRNFERNRRTFIIEILS